MILNYNSQKQLLTNWCWAAVSSNISSSYNPDSPWDQKSIATSVLQINCTNVVPPNHPSECNVIEELSAALVITGNYRDFLNFRLELTDIIREINAGHPIGCQITWDGITRSHFVCVFGYDDISLDLYIGDPESTVYIIPFDKFITNYRGGHWQRSFFTQATT